MLLDLLNVEKIRFLHLINTGIVGMDLIKITVTVGVAQSLHSASQLLIYTYEYKRLVQIEHRIQTKRIGIFRLLGDTVNYVNYVNFC